MRIMEIRADSAYFPSALALRKAVFIDEQNVPESIERDENDAGALHLLAVEGPSDRPVTVGTVRLVTLTDAVKIGRVAVARTRRGTGVGRLLMVAALQRVTRMGFRRAELSSQVPVIGFYERLGFVADSDEYIEAGIPHRHMVWQAGDETRAG